ncbi:MAG: competence/damage-inducible protein A [Ignavibacteria bacterium]|jgi:nicotinamide-nucleotide amidase|nr:competence/damage-inducible protein A [Ignavibacteria bacterium]MDP3830652.1 competence/damage-inducible protein A [Ignavibacteriaceae bacterium]
MNAHIISIGDELLIGQTVNSNASFIGNALSDIQIKVIKISVIGDDKSVLINEFKEALDNADIVITTGGLGPTHDDLTREAVIDFFNTELVKSDAVLEDIKERFARLGRTVTRINEDQAMVPKIGRVIRNYHGTAPGYWIVQDGKIFIVMPGVPFEMKAMMEEFVIDHLKEIIEPQLKSFTKNRTLLTTGIPESTLYEKLGDLNELLGDAKLAFLPSQFGVKLRITVTESNEELATNKLLEIEQRIRGLVGRFIYGKGNEELFEVVARLLTSRGLTIAIAESCTGGHISNLLTNVSGSSKYFERGIVTYSNAAKVEMLKVDEEIIAKYGSVSLEVSRQMADGIRAISMTDIGIAVTGIMGPLGGTSSKPVGTVFIGFCDEKVCTAQKFQFGDDRLLNKQRTSQTVLEIIRKYILGIPFDE